MEDIIIVDNSIYSFAYQIDNGIPILPFREDKEDTEFLHLIKIMKDISKEKDCRNFIRKAFKISEIMKTDMDSYVHLYEISDSDDDLEDEDCLQLLAECQKSLNLSMKRRESECKSKGKKIKKRKRVSLKQMKKAKSEYCEVAQNGIEINSNEDILYSQKSISSPYQLIQFEECSPFASSSNNISLIEEEGDQIFDCSKNLCLKKRGSTRAY